MRPTNHELAEGRPWCIAGGWAACPQLATDQDVWIFVNRVIGEMMNEDRLTFLAGQRKLMLRNYPAITPEGPSLAKSQGDHRDFDDENLQRYGDMHFGIIKVGILRNRHILLTDADDIQALLSCFDISTHQCAIDKDMEFITGTGWTPIGVTPNILREGGPSTAIRLEKITSRYQLA